MKKYSYLFTLILTMTATTISCSPSNENKIDVPHSMIISQNNKTEATKMKIAFLAAVLLGSVPLSIGAYCITKTLLFLAALPAIASLVPFAFLERLITKESAFHKNLLPVSFILYGAASFYLAKYSFKKWRLLNKTFKKPPND